jgi:hypothetical protein
VSAARAQEIARGCLASYPDRNTLQLRNLVIDSAGTQALITGPRSVVNCFRDIDRSIGTVTAKPALPIEWLPGPVAIDAISGDPVNRFETATGRVAGQVSRVTVTFRGGITVHADVVNGTFIARMVYPDGAALPAESGVWNPIARAYDFDGRLVGTVDYTQAAGCYTDPSGKLLAGSRANPAGCKRAVPWQP